MKSLALLSIHKGRVIEKNLIYIYISWLILHNTCKQAYETHSPAIHKNPPEYQKC